MATRRKGCPRFCTSSSRLPIWLRSKEEEEAIDEKQLQDISNEDFTEKPRALSDPLRPKIKLPIHPKVEPDPLPRMLPFHKGVVLIFFVPCQQFALFMLPSLIPLALVRKTYALRKMRKLYEAEKRKNADLREELKSKEARGANTKAQRCDQAKNELVDEGSSGLPDAEGLPAKRHRPGKRNSKMGHKAEKKSRQAVRKVSMMAWADERRLKSEEGTRGTKF